MTLVLHGYRYSVYLRIARIVLAEKGVAYERVEVNPVAADMPLDYLELHPFRRVPTLVDGDFVLYETTAITRYVDEAFPGPALQPSEPRRRARMAQIVAIVDAYGYWPMVRQVAGQRVFAARRGAAPDEALIRSGLDGSHRALAALEAIAAAGGLVAGGPLAGGAVWSLADFHLAPMLAYFTLAPEGASALARYPRLTAWWDVVRCRASLVDTDPGLP
jgi:glutathione S-transferase